MNVDYPYSVTGTTLGVSVKRRTDNKYFDFTSSTFMTSPTSGIKSLVEGSGSYTYLYSTSITTPSSVWLNDDYDLFIHLRTSSDRTIGTGAVYIYNGSDATIIPNTGVTSATSNSVTQVTVTGYIAGQDPRSQLFIDPSNKLDVSSSGGVTTNSVILTGVVNINMSQALPTGSQIVPFTIGDSLSLTISEPHYGIIRNGVPKRNTPLYVTR